MDRRRLQPGHWRDVLRPDIDEGDQHAARRQPGNVVAEIVRVPVVAPSSVLIGSEPGSNFLFLTRFLYVNRTPLCPKRYVPTKTPGNTATGRSGPSLDGKSRTRQAQSRRRRRVQDTR